MPQVREFPQQCSEAVDGRRISSNAKLTYFAIWKILVVVKPEMDCAVPLQIFRKHPHSKIANAAVFITFRAVFPK